MANNSKIISWSDTEIKTDVFTMIINSYHYSPGSWDDTIAFINSSSIFEYKFPLRVTSVTVHENGLFLQFIYYINPTGGPTGPRLLSKLRQIPGAKQGQTFLFRMQDRLQVVMGMMALMS